METLNLAQVPYYYKFADVYHTVYDLKEIKGFYKIEQAICTPIDSADGDSQEYLIVIYVGINHKEIELYYVDKKARDREYKKLSKIFLSETE